MTTTKLEPATLEVCVDCVMLLANGEVFDSHGEEITTQHGAEVDAIWGETEITLGRLHSEECTRWSDTCEHTSDDYDPESWFSWRACDGCGSTLGGDREYATAWTE